MAAPLRKIVLKSESLQKYILNVSTFGREHEQLKNLREATFHKYGIMRAEMGVPPDEGQFLSILLRAMDAKKTLEIGVFTGYSLLATALALPYNGQIVAIDPSREAFEVGLPFIREAGVEHKINFIHSDACPALDEMLKKGEEFDFVFVNADKPNYKKYHEQLIEMVKLGGIIAYQNTLCYGIVTGEEVKDVPCYFSHDGFNVIGEATVDFNSSLASDPRIEISQLSIGNGVTLCMRMI
ncbi:Caffeoyl-CoA O-methyltransferase [Heracleum sosnowskyi]|uniref:Caffeoyl-CoA O-methyltransferase n=1 Tax=Heracleum sosnowskyi TaxID=360622 RepID=A0AAD8ILA8_9APIA|nr:Caffeoyl-CoA O-methyltransferase [Heracleum sosnowskyi]